MFVERSGSSETAADETTTESNDAAMDDAPDLGGREITVAVENAYRRSTSSQLKPVKRRAGITTPSTPFVS